MSVGIPNFKSGSDKDKWNSKYEANKGEILMNLFQLFYLNFTEIKFS